MLVNRFVAIVLVASISLAQAYPALLPYIYNPSKRSDAVFPQIEDDVGELDQLRNEQPVVGKRQDDGSTARTTTTTKESVEKVIASPEDGSKEQPAAAIQLDLERQLEVATPLMSMSTTTTTSTSATTTTAAFKDDSERSQLEEPKTAAKPASEHGAHAKAFYGAARLAFGQNPEVLPTLPTTTTSTAASTTTTTTTTPSTTTTAATPVVATEAVVAAGAAITAAESESEPVEDVAEIDAETDDEAGAAIEGMPDKLPTANQNKHGDINKETIGDILIDQLEAVAKTTERRSSMPHLTAKTAQSLLRNPSGQYSSFDMAQYVFWTGDETGVARAVEELIDENLITRESALKFLRDIRLGIEFLQRSYANRIFPEELRQNHLKRNTAPSTSTSTSTTSTTTTTTSTTTEKPFIHMESDLEGVTPEVGHAKILDSFKFWNKLKTLENETPQDLTDYDETMGRAKIVEYLYNEYSLEEILYKLAKVMFAQSLAHGSDEAQQELQKLTEFLEHEGNLGVIPVDLQKKVLRVLHPALSDTLTEHPELLPAARVNLANPFFRLPMHTPSAV
ncbi:cell wall protein DAN4 isoform X2 [Drosophila grimshawi]|uniref:GH18549 n=1 Tax=Drosophila grimshawi TaxID=7222 RepID=B4JI69_DROGR|nr:cell wall protein DAN4 isoform X2 [Drosophila grimshawi]EDV92950.1 GH18549 [Drosophila grimshawi]